jgi:hypothetical protein
MAIKSLTMRFQPDAKKHDAAEAPRWAKSKIAICIDEYKKLKSTLFKGFSLLNAPEPRRLTLQPNKEKSWER